MIINTWSKRERPVKEKGGGSVIVIPDQALSIRAILERYSRGQSLPKTRDPQYSEEDYSELQKMSTIEKVDLLNQVNQQIYDYQNTPPQPEPTVQQSAEPDATDDDANEPAK